MEARYIPVSTHGLRGRQLQVAIASMCRSSAEASNTYQYQYHATTIHKTSYQKREITDRASLGVYPDCLTFPAFPIIDQLQVSKNLPLHFLE